MKPRNAEAARLEADYLARIKAALVGREASEVDEIIQSVKEHIEEELSGQPPGEVSLVQMANVLERLGPPESYVQEDEGVRKPAQLQVKKKRLSKKALASVLCLPAALFVAALAVAIGRAAFAGEEGGVIGGICGLAVLLAGFILGVAALWEIRNRPEELRGRALAWIGVLQGPVLLLLVILQYMLLRHAS